MKKEYHSPWIETVLLTRLELSFCASELQDLEESGDLGDFDWDYNN